MRNLLIVLALVGLLLLPGCKIKSADMQIGFKAILSWLLPELTQPETISHLLDLDSQGKVDYIVGLAKPRLEGLTFRLRDAIDKGDTAELRTWCATNLPAILPLLDRYTPREILGFVKKASPRLARTIELSSPSILNYLYEKKIIAESDWPSAEKAYRSGALNPTDAELQALAQLLTENWEKAGEQ